MTEPSQYFKGRTVQEQMNEVIGYVDTRSAEVAVNAIAADVAQVHQDMLDADADASAAAASAAAAAGTLANAVKKTGEASQSIAGDIAVAGDLSGGTVTVPTPVNNTDAASKKYVDDADALKLNITDVNSYAVGLTGNQKANGSKEGLWCGYKYTQPAPVNAGKWLRYVGISTRYSVIMTEIIGTQGNNGYCYAKAITSGAGTFNRVFPIENQPCNSNIKVACAINQTTNKMEFWIYVPSAAAVAGMMFYNIYTDSTIVDNAVYYNEEYDALPTVDYTSFVYILGSA